MSCDRLPFRFLSLVTMITLIGLCCCATASAAPVDYARDVQPILAEHCLKCHGPEKQKSGLRVDVRANLLVGGDTGEPAVVPGESAKSVLIRAITGDDSDLVMPPEGPALSDTEIDLLKRWIDQGAQMPEREASQRTTDHWSFQPLAEISPPAQRDVHIKNEIDAFLFTRLQEAGLTFASTADPVTQVRRLFLDMHGLPPSPDQIKTFASNPSDAAWSTLVDEVLASPRYGERWARHWLDVVGFGETDGFEKNAERVHAFRYRDYVIEALNNDKPYDEFVFEQLAGDTVGEDRATGFLVAGPRDDVGSPDPLLTAQQRQDELAFMINTTGTAFLGMTLGCARCHSHKFDPVSQKDYYAVQAVFAGVRHDDRLVRSPEYDAILEHVGKLQAEINAHREALATLPFRAPINPKMNIEMFTPAAATRVRLEVFETNDGFEPCFDEVEIWTTAQPDKAPVNIASHSTKPIVTASGTLPGFPFHQLAFVNDGRHGNNFSWVSNIRGGGWLQFEFPEQVTIDRVVWGRDRTGKSSDRTATSYTISVSASHDGPWHIVTGSFEHLQEGAELPPGVSAEDVADAQERLTRIDQLETQKAQALQKAPYVYGGRFEQPGPTFRLVRGEALSRAEQVAPGALEILEERLGSLDLSMDASESDRRVRLAKWIVDPKHPLTPRVMVNRIWQHHFGQGIVATPSDFGAMGMPPSHLALLDWLAREFIGNRWSIKHVHRLILNSHAYRQASLPDAEALSIDAGSQLLWRFPPRRLEAEVIRDSMLAVSGVLDLTMGGPGFSAFKPNNNYVRVYEPKESFEPTDYRRMVYMLKVRMEQDGTFGVFDCPDAAQVCPKRPSSTTPLQALNLLNSAFVLEQARLLADRLQREAGNDPVTQVRRAFHLAFGREPFTDESQAAVELIAAHGLEAFGRALFNANEFLFLP